MDSLTEDRQFIDPGEKENDDKERYDP